MLDRAAAIDVFLTDAGWGGAIQAPLAGDASNRRYLRVSRNNGQERAVLMDAPADKGEDVRPFVQIAQWLKASGFSAPEIFAEDAQKGFLLLEDLGDDLFARVIPAAPGSELTLYAAATQLLAELHQITPPDHLAPYCVDVMTDMAALAYDWYLRAAVGEDEAAKQIFSAAMHKTLTQYTPDQTVLIQRDYHSENLLWLPQRDGTSRVGLLDFQDAMLGHPAYDLVSLLQDARRDVPPAVEAEMIAQYIRTTSQDTAEFEAAYHVLGAQRNLRILGVFARLCVRDGKAHYVDLIPRVWDLLQRDLQHPALQPVAATLANTLPEPTQSLLQKLKDKCATIPAL